MDTATLKRCILEEDTTSLSRLPGIGKKTADRLVIDMRDRLGPLPAAGPAGLDVGGGLPDLPADAAAEAVSALISLGLKPPEASRRVAAIDSADLACEDIVRLALKAMVK